MYRLQTKIASPLFIVALVVSAACVAFVPTLEPCQYFTQIPHFSILAIGLVGLSMVAPLIMFDRATMVQKYRICMTMIALACIYGIIGNMCYNYWKVLPGGALELSVAQVIVMILGAMLSVFPLYKLEPIDTFSDGGLDRLQKNKPEGAQAQDATQTDNPSEVDSTVPLSADPKASVNKLRGVSGSKTDIPAQEPAQADSPEKSSSIQSPPQVEIDLEASDEMLSGPLNPNPQLPQSPKEEAAPQGQDASATGNRIQSARRRNTSTFTKLQALSASGTGSAQSPKPQVSEGSGDLKSLLDRLDTEEEEKAPASKAEVAKQPVQEPTVTPEPKPEPEPAPVSSAAPALPKEKISPPNVIRVDYIFDDLDEKKDKSSIRVSTGMPEVQKVETKTAPEPEPAKAEEVPAPKPEVKSPSQSASNLESLLDRQEAALEKEAPKPKVEEKVEEKVEAKPSQSNLEGLLDRQEAALDKKVEEKEPVKESVEESALEDSTSSLLSKRFMELSEEEKKEKPTKEEPKASTAVQEKEVTKEEDADSGGEKVFDTSVDSDIDDIFTTLAPEEAQQEVKAPQETKETQEPQVKEEVQVEKLEEKTEAEEKVFKQGVDSDIDDIFTNLAPEEAQRTVDETPAKETVAAKEDVGATEKVESKEEEEDKIFNLKDDDVDDIFSGLTTTEQKDVDQSTLEKVKEKSSEEPAKETPKEPAEQKEEVPPKKRTGEMPTLNKEQAQKIREQANKPGRFSDTLSKIPSLKNTVEGLLQSLEEDQTVDDDDDVIEEEVVTGIPEENLSTEQKAARDASEKLKDFGRLSSKAVAPQDNASENQGTMKTIGKLLIDKQAVEKIIKSGESKELGKGLTNARIISAARGKGISDLLVKINQYEGVAGSIVVGHDGLVMSSTLQDGWDKDMMGALSTALLSTSNLTTKKLEIGKLRQMVMLTKDNGKEKTTVLTDVDVGILAVFVEETDVSKIDGLLTTIQETIHG